jgi:2-oxoglutarate ferredoxin oxidoreductase subunit beta
MANHPALEKFRQGVPGTPHNWCRGCGIGQIWHYTVKALVELGLSDDEVLWVAGSGCAGRMCTYWHKDYFHTLHGRCLPFATGIKAARPDLTVLVHSGDGECIAIGGNHLIHAARRNVDVTVISVNNLNYAMTGGQFSPTTPLNANTATSPYGSLEPPVRLSELVVSLGGTYVARWTTSHPRQVINSIKKGIRNKGFSFIEILSQCPTQYGRRNKLADPVALMEWLKSQTITVKEAAEASPEELKDKFVIGELASDTRPEFIHSLRELAKDAQKA